MMKLVSRFYLLIVMCFLYLPILFLVVFSFNSGETMVNFEGFSMQWYQELFSDLDLFLVILNTLILGLVSSLLATIVGFVGAFVIHNSKDKKRDTLLALNSILLVSPDVIIGISFLLLYSALSIKLGFFTVLASHVAFSIPIVIILLLPRIEQLNKNVFNAAHDLGASNSQIVRLIILPLMYPAILSSFFTALTYSLDDFAVTFFVTGNGFSTLGLEIYASARQGISLEINALSTIIFVFTLLLAISYYLVSTKKGVKDE